MGLVFVYFFSSILINRSGVTFAEGNRSNYEIQSDIDDGESFCLNDANNEYIEVKSMNEFYFLDDIIELSFEVNSESSIENYNYNQVGFEVLSVVLSDAYEISVKMKIATENEESSLSLQVSLDSKSYLYINIYSVVNEDVVFISQYSKDDAYEKYLQYSLKNGLLSEKQCDKLRNDFISNGVDENVEIINDFPIDSGNVIVPQQTEEHFDRNNNPISTYANKDTYVTGQVTWIDDNGVVHPMRRVLVQIYDEDVSFDDYLGYTHTDNSGNYSFTFQNQDGFWDFEDGGCDIYVKIHAGTSNVKVTNSSGTEYIYQSSVSDDVSTGTTIPKSLQVNMSTDFGRACQIGQAALTARDYAWIMSDKQPSDMTIHYPEGTGCAYNRGSKTIKITNTAATNTSVPESYASWDVIMHEYGHHISHEYGTINTISSGYSHSFNSDLSDLYGKEVGTALAWKEAWPTAFGMVAQNYYSPFLTNIVSTNNDFYDAYNFSRPFNIENMIYRSGESCEGSVMGMLWDIFDSANETHDSLSLSAQQFWNVTTSNSIKTFGEFVNNFYQMYPSRISALGENLSYYQIAPSIPRLSNLSSLSNTNTPNFSWSAQGGSKFPNNNFSLNFYGSKNGSTPYYTISNITSNSYKLSQTEWDIVRYFNGTIYVAVKGENTVSPTVGSYISEFMSFVNPAVLYLQKSANPDTVNNGRYYESIFTLRKGEVARFSVKFNYAGKRMIQTFGTLDTYIEIYDDSNTKVAYNDDDGYNFNAFINYQFEDSKMYYINVRFCSNSTSGKVKLAITAGDYGNSFNSLEKVEIDTGYQNVYESYLSKGRTKVFTLQTTNDLYSIYTWYPSSKIDLYLYLIDPRSVDAISSSQTAANVYNDDGLSDNQAKIEKELIKDVPYVLIVSAYNPNSSSGSSGQFGFTIDRL